MCHKKEEEEKGIGYNYNYKSIHMHTQRKTRKKEIMNYELIIYILIDGYF